MVDDVEALALEHPRDEPLEAQRERDPPDRAVVGDGDGLTDLDDVLRRRVVAPGRGDDAHLVAHSSEFLVALADVRVRAARPRIRVWADDPDLHFLIKQL